MAQISFHILSADKHTREIWTGLTISRNSLLFTDFQASGIGSYFYCGGGGHHKFVVCRTFLSLKEIISKTQTWSNYIVRLFVPSFWNTFQLFKNLIWSEVARLYPSTSSSVTRQYSFVLKNNWDYKHPVSNFWREWRIVAIFLRKLRIHRPPEFIFLFYTISI